jgi:hypothetical protein
MLHKTYTNTIVLTVNSSGVKYLGKNTLKYYLRCFLGYLYFTLLLIFWTSFYFMPLYSKIKWCTFDSLHFLWQPKVLDTFWMLSWTGIWSNSCTYHPYCLWSDRLTKHKCLVCELCVSVWVCPWLSVNFKNKKIVPPGLLHRNLLLQYILAITFTFDS